jgi:hypothetical protein
VIQRLVLVRSDMYRKMTKGMKTVSETEQSLAP